MRDKHEQECPLNYAASAIKYCEYCPLLRKAQARALREADAALLEIGSPATWPIIEGRIRPWLRDRADRIERGEA